ncbi:hypothetical protein EDD15DRAFT_2114433, partial [Pisolithus albus]
NVTSYPLDLHGIASMVNGSLMPRPPTILATLIAISFIGTRELPKRWVHSMFRVRRRAVCMALMWLKENNPKFYGKVSVDEGRLNLLPEDDVPMEI